MKHMLKKWANESGAIMLEVVAVLSLMGLMGTMLFRQIYLRNQELHNIQMASEIRLVKEGFSAWIQARHSTLATICGTPPLGEVRSCMLTGADVDEIADFLPEGYFAAGDDDYTRDSEIKDNYDLFLSSYWRGISGEEILTFYGVVIPKRVALPDGGEDPSTWNFRRAARVAMLIGIDGGAFGPDITEDTSGAIIAGAVGTWSLPITDFDGSDGGDAADVGFSEIPTYVAITGIDVYQPELNLPDIQLGLEDDWSLALNNATAYGKFTAGSLKKNGCYVINTRTAVIGADGVARLSSDSIGDPNDPACLPAFYVEASNNPESDAKATGNVYVLNDLRVGHDYKTGVSSMRFDKDGMIIFEGELGPDPSDPTNASNLRDKRVYDPQTGKDIHYMLDPRYTSVMNDIKVMSRGGAKLSDILPNYILKQVLALDASGTNTTKDGDYWDVKIPEKTTDPAYCPTGYKLAIVAEPTKWGKKDDVTKKKFDLDKNGLTLSTTTTNISGSNVLTSATLGTDASGVGPFVTGVSTRDLATGETGDVVTDVKTQRAVYIGLGTGASPSAPTGTPAMNGSEGRSKLEEDNPSGSSQKHYYIGFGTLDSSGNFVIDTEAEGVAHLYCVFPQDFDWNGAGTAGTGSKPSPEECSRFKDQGDCEGHGCTWTTPPDPGTCG